MQAAAITRAEQNVDRAASALFAGACGYAAFTWLGQRTGLPLLGAEAAAAVGAAYLLCFRLLSGVKPAARKAPLSVFDLRSLDDIEPDELLLTESHQPTALSDNPFERAEQLLLEHYKAAPVPEAGIEEEPLLLDDILAELAPDSFACSTPRKCRLRDSSSRESIAISAPARHRSTRPTRVRRCTMRSPNCAARSANPPLSSALR